MIEKLKNIYKFFQRCWEDLSSFVNQAITSIKSFLFTPREESSENEMQSIPVTNESVKSELQPISAPIKSSENQTNDDLQIYPSSTAVSMERLNDAESASDEPSVDEENKLIIESKIKPLVTEIIDKLKCYPKLVRCLPVEVMDVDLFIERYRGENNLVGLLESRFRGDINPVDMGIIKEAFLKFKEIINSTADQLFHEKDIKTAVEAEAGIRKFNDQNDERENRATRIMLGLDPNGTPDPELAKRIVGSIQSRKKH